MDEKFSLNSDGPIFQRTELTTEDSNLFPSIVRNRCGVMQCCVNISSLTANRNRKLQDKDSVNDNNRNSYGKQEEYGKTILTETTAVIASDIKIIQQQVEQLRQALINGSISVDGIIHTAVPHPPKTQRKADPTPGRRKRIGSRYSPGTIPIYAVAALLKQRIAEIRSDEQKLIDFSKQCSLYTEYKSEKLKLEKKGTLDYVLFNKDPFIIATYGEDEHVELIKKRSAERDARSAAVRQANKDSVLQQHTHSLAKLNIKKQRMLKMVGTLSTRKAIELTAVRSWYEIILKWKAMRTMLNVVLTYRNEKLSLITNRETAAVRVLENWWCNMKTGKSWCVSAIRTHNFISQRANPWKERAKSRVLNKRYHLLIHFLKDLAASKRVVIAITKLVKRTKHIQRWYRREIAVRRAKRRVWLLQWLKFETFARTSHDLKARRDIKKHKVGETMVHSSVSKKTRGKEATLIPRRANLDISVYKKIVGSPTLSQEIREEAIFTEFMIASKNHVAKVFLWEAEVREYQQALEVILVKKKQITASGSILDSALLEQLHLPIPPPPKPTMPLILPGADLMKLIETTTKRAAVEIALKVAANLENENEN